MSAKNPFHIITRRYVSEKSSVLQGLCKASNNRSIRRCKNPKYVFIVAPTATKPEIAWALEEIYKEQQIRVISVNTIRVKPTLRRMRGRKGKTPGFKKAIVTLDPKDTLDNV